MKKLVSVLILLASVSVFAEQEPVTYHLQIKNWPDRKKIDSQINELVKSKACYDINGSPTTPEVNCHKFAWYKSDKAPGIKMVIGYSAGKMTVAMYKWDGKKAQRILNSSAKFNVEDIKTEVINWSFK